jgi:hypothetical protein
MIFWRCLTYFFRLLMTKFMTIVWYHVGITTIAGGKSMRGGHIDGPSDDAKFSTDFEVRYIRGSCSLLVIDRGNQAILEIPLHDNDCAYQDEFGFPLGTYIAFELLLDQRLLLLHEFRLSLNLLLRQDKKHIEKGLSKTVRLMTSTLDVHRTCIAFCCWFLWLYACIAPTPDFWDGINNRCNSFLLLLLFQKQITIC